MSYINKPKFGMPIGWIKLTVVQCPIYFGRYCVTWGAYGFLVCAPLLVSLIRLLLNLFIKYIYCFMVWGIFNYYIVYLYNCLIDWNMLIVILNLKRVFASGVTKPLIYTMMSLFYETRIVKWTLLRKWAIFGFCHR